MHSYTLLAEWHQTPLISLAQETVADHQPPAKALPWAAPEVLSHPRAITLGSS